MVIKMLVKQGIIKKDKLELKYVEIELKNTKLLLLEGYNAFFMCGALDVKVYRNREVICGKAIGVKTIEQLLNAEIKELSEYAKLQGLTEGMLVYEAFSKISDKK